MPEIKIYAKDFTSYDEAIVRVRVENSRFSNQECLLCELKKQNSFAEIIEKLNILEHQINGMCKYDSIKRKDLILSYISFLCEKVSSDDSKDNDSVSNNAYLILQKFSETDKEEFNSSEFKDKKKILSNLLKEWLKNDDYSSVNNPEAEGKLWSEFDTLLHNLFNSSPKSPKLFYEDYLKYLKNSFENISAVQNVIIEETNKLKYIDECVKRTIKADECINSFLSEVEKSIIQKKTVDTITGEETQLYFLKLNSEKGTVEIPITTSSKDFISNKIPTHFLNDEKMPNIVGVLRWKDFRFDNKEYDITLTIGSRFDDKEYYLLPAMLKYSKSSGYGGGDVPFSEENIFHFMYLYRFAKQLVDAYRDGPYRTYVRFERNDDKLRGAIDVSRHIRLNMNMNNGKVAYSYRENTINNPINHLIINTYNYAKRLYPELTRTVLDNNKDFKKAYETIKNLIGFEQIGSVTDSLKKTNRIITSPFYSKYEDLRKTCRNFLHHMGLSFIDGTSDETVSGLLFYVPDLWEEYLEYYLKTKLKDARINAQEKIRVGYPVDENDEIVCDDARACGKTYPDYVLYGTDDNVNPILVLDAKYKKAWSEGKRFHLEDYTKCIRDMNSTSTHVTGVIYPVIYNKQWDDETIDDFFDSELNVKNCKLIVQKQYNNTDYFYRIPVYIPSTKHGQYTYTSWSSRMNYSMGKSMEFINSLFDEELERVNGQEAEFKEFRKMKAEFEEFLAQKKTK